MIHLTQKKDSNVNYQNNTDNPYILKPGVQKQWNNTILKKFVPSPIIEPVPARLNQEAVDPPASFIPPPIPELSIPNVTEPFIPPIPEPSISPPIPEPDELLLPYEPPPPYENAPPYREPSLEDIFIGNEIDNQPKISFLPKTDGTHGNVNVMPSDDEVHITKYLNDTDIQITTNSTLNTYVTTKPKKKQASKKR